MKTLQNLLSHDEIVKVLDLKTRTCIKTNSQVNFGAGVLHITREVYFFVILIFHTFHYTLNPKCKSRAPRAAINVMLITISGLLEMLSIYHEKENIVS